MNADTDNNQMSDCYEIQYSLSPTDPSDALLDSDGDGLTTLDEYLANTNPNASDTDGDGLNDGLELSFGFSAFYIDTNNDGVSDYDEYLAFVSTQQDGDANGDGVVNVADLLLLQRHVHGYIVLPDDQMARVDLYPPGAPNGILNIQNMLLLNRQVLGVQ